MSAIPRTVFCLIMYAAVLSLAGCDGNPEASTPPPPLTVSAPTPVLDRYSELWERYELYAFTYATLYCSRIEPGLGLSSDAPPDAQHTLRAFLMENQPLITELIDASHAAPERFPPPPDLSVPAPERYLDPATQLKWFSALLQTDAGRCWDDGESDDAVSRVSAALRLAQQLAGQPDFATQLRGDGERRLGLRKLLAMARNGLGDRITLETRTVLLETIERLGVESKQAIVATWAQSARDMAADSRKRFGGRGGGEALADWIDEVGVNNIDLSELGLLEPGFLIRRDLDTIRRLRPAEIEAAIAAAEAIIPPLSESLVSSTPEDASALMRQRILDDPTQIARVVIGGPAALLQMREKEIATVTELRGLLAADP